MNYLYKKYNMENIFESEKNFTDFMQDVVVGDTIRIISGGKTFDSQVLNVTQNQIGIEMAGVKYLIHPNSLNGDTLETFRVSGGNKYKAITRDVTKITLIRNGSIVNAITPKKPSKNNSTNKKDIILPFFKDAYKSIQEEFSKITDKSKILIKTGKLSTNDTINDTTISEMELKVVKIFKNSILKVLVENVSGSDSSLNKLKNTYLRMNLNTCLLLDQKGIKIEFKTMEKPYTKVFVEDVFDIEVNEYQEKTSKVTLDDLWSKKEFRDLYNKEPSLFGKLLGQGPKGIARVNQLMDKYGVNKTYNTKNSKVEFEYIGKQLNTEIVRLNNGDRYVGKFITAREIRLINPNKRNISISIKLIDEIRMNTYTVHIMKNTIKNSQSVSEKIGEGVIKILNKNFK